MRYRYTQHCYKLSRAVVDDWYVEPWRSARRRRSGQSRAHDAAVAGHQCRVADPQGIDR